MIYHAQCACGAIQIEAEGEPVIQCYCHCTQCRAHTGAPVNAPVLWPRAKVRFTAGEDKLAHYSRTGHAEGGSYSCSQCLGHIAAYLPNANLFDIFVGALRDFEFKPTVHLNYENAVLPIKDGLPKLKDMPESAGGSGILLEE